MMICQGKRAAVFRSLLRSPRRTQGPAPLPTVATHETQQLVYLGLVFLLGAFVFTGCSVVQPTLKVDYYQLDYPIPALAKAGSPLDVVVGIRRFGIASAYDHDRLVVREKDLRIHQSYYHRWVNNPRMMLADLLLRDMLASGMFKAVVVSPASVLSDYEISGFVQEISKDDSGEHPKVKLSMDITLLKSNSAAKEESRVVLQKSYMSEQPCPDTGPAGIAKAMSAAFQDLCAQIQKDTYAGIMK